MRDDPQETSKKTGKVIEWRTQMDETKYKFNVYLKNAMAIFKPEMHNAPGTNLTKICDANDAPRSSSKRFLKAP